MNVDRISIVIKTTAVEPINSSRVDQVTFCISVRTSDKKFCIFLTIAFLISQARRDSNPQQAVLETAALANWSYWPKTLPLNLC